MSGRQPTLAAGGDDVNATVLLDARQTVGPIDPRIFSGFLINRRPDADLAVTVEMGGAGFGEVMAADVLTGDDPRLANTWDAPDAVRPRPGEASVLDDGRLRVEVPGPGLVAVRVGMEHPS